jgi:hypothetical protein
MGVVPVMTLTRQTHALTDTGRKVTYRVGARFEPLEGGGYRALDKAKGAFLLFAGVVHLPEGRLTPDYETAILAESPIYGEAFTTSDGALMEWYTDMATGLSGYCQIN